MTRYKAIADMVKRIVFVEPEGGKVIEIPCVNSNVKKDSIWYALDTSLTTLETIPVVKEFTDVFDEVSCLPPHREISFRIDLILNAKPVVHVVRRMATKEREELKVQTLELLSKGLIRASYLSWRAATKFVPKSDGDLRICVDYRDLNKQTLKISTLFPA